MNVGFLEHFFTWIKYLYLATLAGAIVCLLLCELQIRRLDRQGLKDTPGYANANSRFFLWTLVLCVMIILPVFLMLVAAVKMLLR